MTLLALLASLVLPCAVDPTQPATNRPHGQFQVLHVPADEMDGHSLHKCEYGDGTKCFFMNRERVTRPVLMKFRIDGGPASPEGVVAEAEYVAWLQKNNNACHYADNDAAVKLLGKAPYRQGYVGMRNADGVVFDAHRIEMDSSVITREIGDKVLEITQWQICVGMDPKHGAVIESDKHPVGGLLFNIGTRVPDAPKLAGVKGLHESFSATVLLPAAWRDRTAALGLRAIPTRMATAQPYDAGEDPDAPLPAPTYACPDWSDYQGQAIGTALGDEIRPAEKRWDTAIDNDDNMLHFAIKMKTDPDKAYVVCTYARDKVNNISPMSTPLVVQSYRATDMFTAMPEEMRLHMGHGCANVGLTAWSCAYAGCAWALAAGRLRRRGRKTRL